MNTPLDVCLWTVKQFHGRWYRWGGDSPAGFDCSGLCIEGLKAAGVLERKFDTTADGLMKDQGWNPPDELHPGCLVFWGSNGKATHVEMVVGVSNTQSWTIGASGGGSGVRTVDDAIRLSAWVKVRPTRDGYIAIRDPFEEWR